MSKADYSTSTEIPPSIYTRVEELALEAAFDGATRISTRLLLETARAELKTKINNNVIPALGRLLIKNNPHLDGIVRIKELGGRGKNKRQEQTDLELVASQFAPLRSQKVTGIVVLMASGVLQTFDIAYVANNIRKAKKGQ